MRQIEVVPYNPNWPKMFEEESVLLKQALKDNCINVHHVGSTAVPGLAAKPKIDIIVVVKETIDLIKNLEAIGYEFRGEFNIPFHFGFRKRSPINVNLHVFEEGNPEIELNLLFRDYLRTHEDAQNEYAQLKTHLLTQPTSFVKNNPIFVGYTLGKDDFIRKILDRTGFNRLCIRHCAHHQEWETAKILRQKYVFDKIPISDPYTWTFNDPGHVHFVLYQGTKIVGYAHLQLLLEHKAAIRIFVIDQPFQGQGFEEQFLTLCEKWVKTQGYTSLEVSQDSVMGKITFNSLQN